MLDPAQFIAACLARLAQGGGSHQIADLVRQALASQREQPDKWGRSEILHASDDLMIVDLTLPPFATSAVHDHRTWAVIGIADGCEVDQLVTEHDGAFEWGARHALHPGDVLVLEADCIHFIGNPLPRAARGIHVYGKHLGRTERRMWHPETGLVQRMDFGVFEQWEHALTARTAAAGSIVAPALPQMSPDERAVREAHRTWIAAVNAGDLARLLDLATQDVVFVGPGDAPFGRDGLPARFSQGHEAYHLRCSSELQEVVIAGDLAHTLSQDMVSLRPRSGGPATTLAGHRLTLYRKGADGRWRLARDIHTLTPSPD